MGRAASCWRCGAGPIVAVRQAAARLALGSKRGASGRRQRAVLGDVRRMKVLVRRHMATVGYRLVSYGMQEVRGSNPRSSTRKARSGSVSRRNPRAFKIA
jgi:hypothetical protein